MNISLQKPDTIGALASSLCVIHCLVTPVIFAAQGVSALHHDTVPIWWKNIDFLFVAISVFAVYRSANNSNNSFIKYALWLSWFSLLILILNEKLIWLPLSELITYTVAFTLASLHLYNLNYCQCATDQCCSQEFKN